MLNGFSSISLKITWLLKRQAYLIRSTIDNFKKISTNRGTVKNYAKNPNAQTDLENDQLKAALLVEDRDAVSKPHQPIYKIFGTLIDIDLQLYEEFD